MNHHDIENRLRRLPRPEAPDRLRRRVLDAAGEAVGPGQDREPGFAAFALSWAAVLAAGFVLHAVATGGPHAGTGRRADDAAVRDGRPVEAVWLVEGLVPADDPRFGGTDLVGGARGSNMEILR